MGKAARVAGSLMLLLASASAETIEANPSNYQSLVSTLQPGDTMLLAPGDYPDGFNIRDVYGTADAWIVIQGPDSGPQPVFLGDPTVSRNTIEIRTGSYFALENLTIDGQNIDGVFGISAAGSDTHHVRIENCTIVGHGGHQQVVGISTKVTTWGWIIRRNRILGAGTGLYLGNADGSLPFIGGLIEYNLVEDAEGYCMQIKHQNSRPDLPGMPSTPQRTIIRHNVFLKTDRPSGDGDRPNLLVDGFPATGNGSQDHYEIYGNFFFHNPREALLQASGRVVIHDNVFVDCTYEGIFLVDHNTPLKTAHVYNNTFFAMNRAIHFVNTPDEAHSVFGNLMFADSGVSGNFTNASDNLFAAAANAGDYVQNPSLVLGEMDFHPLVGQCQGPPLDLSAFLAHLDFDLDFNGAPKLLFTFRGAYAGEGLNPGWQLTNDVKGEAGGAPLPDTTPPTGSLAVDGGASQTSDALVDLSISAADPGANASGMGPGAQMSFSNDGSTWSAPEPYGTSRADWDLAAFGGDDAPGPKTVHARLRDAAGNWTVAAITSDIELL
ncbi:MAG: hypothetical protein ACREID_08010, partial [Planctomycetota bacterium]